MNQFVIALSLFVAGLVHFSTGCFPNTVCVKDRDTIIQSDLNLNTPPNESKIWYIKPKQTHFDAVLAFKNFSSTTMVEMIIYDDSRRPITKTLQNRIGNFEIVVPHCDGVLIHVHSGARQSAEFVLNYYTDCTILSGTEDEINHLPYVPTNERCWVIHPRDSNDRKRIYFSLRDIYLPKQQIMIWDLDTSNMIVRANAEDYSIVAAESYDIHYSQSIMVELKCQQASCDERYNRFSIGYYTMNQKDSICIEKQKKCSDKDPFGTECNMRCEAADRIIVQEFNIQAPQTSLPSVRSGPAGDNKSKKTESKCLLPEKFCRCPKHIKRSVFCEPHIKCIKLVRCAYACIYHKVVTCPRVRKLTSITLL